MPCHKVERSKTRYERDDAILLVISAGMPVGQAVRIAGVLAGAGVPLTVLDAYCIEPIDKSAIRELAEKILHVLVVEDHYEEGALFRAVKKALEEHPHIQTDGLYFLALKTSPLSEREARWRDSILKMAIKIVLKIRTGKEIAC